MVARKNVGLDTLKICPLILADFVRLPAPLVVLLKMIVNLAPVQLILLQIYVLLPVPANSTRKFLRIAVHHAKTLALNVLGLTLINVPDALAYWAYIITTYPGAVLWIVLMVTSRM